MLQRLERFSLAALSRLDAWCNRWYGARLNPLYQSGTIVVGLYLVLLVTGLYLLLFYRVAAPWESVARLTADAWVGRTIRGVHRYATGAAVVFTLVHAIRMFAQARSWGARAMAWLSGVVLLVLLVGCAWTGYVMVWDVFGERLAREAARMADSLPFLSEPVSRTFTGERPVPTFFFFVTLFAHVAVPLGMGVVFWLHVRRLQRPLLLPPRPLLWSVVGLLIAAAVSLPVALAPEADPFVRHARIQADLLIAPWLPPAPRLSGGALLGVLAAGCVLLFVVPLLTRRRGARQPMPSVVDEDVCTGCTQCSIDCPYGAIEMVARTDGRPTPVARVDPALCVSCGICAGSCAPMSIGPPGRTGRDQLAAVGSLLDSSRLPPSGVVVVGCTYSAGAFATLLEREGAAFHGVDCAGNLHTSVVERLIRGGIPGVLVIACHTRDCRHREGSRWLVERVFHERDAELQARVPRSRVRVIHAGARESARAIAALRRFIVDLTLIGRVVRLDDDLDDMAECEAAEVNEVPQ